MSLLMKIMMKLGGHPDELEIIEFALDGIQDGVQREKISRHLQGCKPCRDAVAAAMEMNVGLALAVPRVEPPKGLADRIIKQVAQAPGNANRFEEGKP